jgi:hypothetical protein
MNWKLLIVHSEVAYETFGSCLWNKWKLLMKRIEVAYLFGDIMQNKNHISFLKKCDFGVF